MHTVYDGISHMKHTDWFTLNDFQELIEMHVFYRPNDLTHFINELFKYVTIDDEVYGYGIEVFTTSFTIQEVLVFPEYHKNDVTAWDKYIRIHQYDNNINILYNNSDRMSYYLPIDYASALLIGLKFLSRIQH